MIYYLRISRISTLCFPTNFFPNWSSLSSVCGCFIWLIKTLTNVQHFHRAEIMPHNGLEFTWPTGQVCMQVVILRGLILSKDRILSQIDLLFLKISLTFLSCFLFMYSSYCFYICSSAFSICIFVYLHTKLLFFYSIYCLFYFKLILLSH